MASSTTEPIRHDARVGFIDPAALAEIDREKEEGPAAAERRPARGD